MKRTICAAIFAAACLAAPSASGKNILYADDMAVACQGVEAATALHDKDLLYIDTPGARECWAAFQAIQLIDVSLQKEFRDTLRICAPSNADAGIYARVFLRYVEKHPKETAIRFYTEVALDAFKEAWPCSMWDSFPAVKGDRR